jgi:GTPase involved in cell partitioning and DNA repair
MAAVVRWVASAAGSWLCRWPVTCAGARQRGHVAVLAGRGADGWAALAGAVRVGARSAGGPDAGTGGRVCRVRVKKSYVAETLSKLRFLGTS